MQAHKQVHWSQIQYTETAKLSFFSGSNFSLVHLHSIRKCTTRTGLVWSVQWNKQSINFYLVAIIFASSSKQCWQYRISYTLSSKRSQVTGHRDNLRKSNRFLTFFIVVIKSPATIALRSTSFCNRLIKYFVLQVNSTVCLFILEVSVHTLTMQHILLLN